MQLVEVMVAVAVFTAASAGALQLFAEAAGSSQQLELRRLRLERIELDRLQLQAHWRRQLQGACAASPEQLKTLAVAWPAPPQVQREVVVGAQLDELWLRWRFAGEPAPVRARMVTTAGLGSSCMVRAPFSARPQEAGT